MNIAETVTAMPSSVREPTPLLLLRSCSIRRRPRALVDSDCGGSSARSGCVHTHTRWDDLEIAVVAGAVLRRRLADDLAEAGAERAERGAPDGETRLGDRQPLAQKRLRPLDASGHEVGVWRLA